MAYEIKPILKGTYLTIKFSKEGTTRFYTRKGNQIDELDTYLSKKWYDVLNNIKHSDLLTKNIKPSTLEDSYVNIVYQVKNEVPYFFVISQKNVETNLIKVKRIETDNLDFYKMSSELPYDVYGFQAFENNELKTSFYFDSKEKKDKSFADLGLIVKLSFVNWMEDNMLNATYFYKTFKENSTYFDKYVELMAEFYADYRGSVEGSVVNKINMDENISTDFLPNLDIFPISAQNIISNGGQKESRMFSFVLYNFSIHRKTMNYPTVDWVNRVNKIKKYINLIITD